VRGCQTCLRIKAVNQKPTGLLSPLDIPLSRGEHIYIDFVTKLLTMSQNHDTIVTIIDGLTKRVHRFTIQEADLTAEQFAQLILEHYFRAHKIPVSIASDRDV
jgi:hypothetical protein